jgi:GNAT superfamily N-acetyltransferase
LAHTAINKRTLISATGLPNYPVPVILLARLAVDKEFQGMAIGSKSLVYSLRHAYRISNQEQGVPSFGLVLDVLNKKAMNFYQQFEFFEPMSEDPLRLFVSMSSLAEP